MALYWYCYMCKLAGRVVLQEIPDVWVDGTRVCRICFAGRYTGKEVTYEIPPAPVPDGTDVEAEAKKRKDGHLHKPIPGCPSRCPGPHFHTLTLEAPGRAKAGEEIELVAVIKPAILPSAPRGTLRWAIESGPLVFGKQGKRWGPTDAGQDRVRVTVEADAEDGDEAVVACTFNFGSEKDEDRTRRTRVAVGADLEPTDEEREASRDAKLRFEEIDYAIPKYHDYDRLVKAWLLYGFEIGESAFASTAGQPKVDDFDQTFGRFISRLGSFQVDGFHDTLERKVVVRGFADHYGSEDGNRDLRAERAERAIDAILINVSEARREHFTRYTSNLLQHEQEAVYKIGTYPSTNSTLGGRARNRSVIFFEYLTDLPDVDSNEEIKKKKEELRRERLEEHFGVGALRVEAFLEKLPPHKNDPRKRFSCLLSKTYGGKSVFTLLKEAYARFHAGAKTFPVFRRNYDSAVAHKEELYFPPRGMGLALKDEGVLAGQPKTFDERDHCTSLTSALLEAFADTPTAKEADESEFFDTVEAEFLRRAHSVRRDIHDGLHGYSNRAIDLAGAGGGRKGATPAWRQMTQLLHERLSADGGVYSCFSDHSVPQADDESWFVESLNVFPKGWKQCESRSL